MHIVTTGASGAAMGAAVMLAQIASRDAYFIVPAAVSSLAAIGGFGVALTSYLRHRNDASELELHERHDDDRFDTLEKLIMFVHGGDPKP